MAQSPPRKTICHRFQACAISICDNLQGGCLRERQNLSWRLPVSLAIKRQDMFASAAPLSDAAVPKALPIPASEPEERRRRLCEDPLQRPANKITRRHSPRGTIWLPHILYLLSLPPRRRRFLYLCSLSWPPTHPLQLVKEENLLQAINHRGDRCQHICLLHGGNVFLTVCCP